MELQQPVQEVGSHEHMPLPTMHWSPGGHSGFPSQSQALPVEQSPRGLQLKHATPPVPQTVAECIVMHDPPWQQPIGHEPALHPPHMWFVQPLPPHDWQARPPCPHDGSVVPGSHPPSLSQQPFMHVVTSHTHWPPLHQVVPVHAGPLPHWHVPLAHVSARGGLPIPQS
jgi:hypothetical protein